MRGACVITWALTSCKGHLQSTTQASQDCRILDAHLFSEKAKTLTQIIGVQPANPAAMPHKQIPEFAPTSCPCQNVDWETMGCPRDKCVVCVWVCSTLLRQATPLVGSSMATTHDLQGKVGLMNRGKDALIELALKHSFMERTIGKLKRCK